MTSIKIKFRPFTVNGKEGGLYFQIIHNRVVRQLNTDYKVFAEEWDAEAESVPTFCWVFKNVWHGTRLRDNDTDLPRFFGNVGCG